jgi:hypothetical protein
MSKPEAPTPPNPRDTAQAQTGTNIGTAISNAMMNNINQVGPNGSLNYSQSGTYNYTDPYTGQTYAIPQFTQTTTLSDAQKAIQAQDNQTQLNLAQLGNQQSSKLSDLLGSPMSLDGAPAAGDPSAITSVPGAQTNIDTSGLANASNITSSYGSDFDLASVQKALMAQMQPQLDVQQQKLQQQLADQGIKYGSAAYNNAMQPFGQQENNAWMQSITNATAQQAQAMQTAQQQAAFKNAAQGQAFSQAATEGGFTNSALQQQLAQAQAGYNAQNTTRGNYLQEQYAARDQPINEITSLLSGGQVTMPQFGQTNNNQIPTTDVAGLINNNFAQQSSNYQQANQNYQTLMGGILGLGGNLAKAGATYMSDRNVKDDIDRIGTVFAASEEGERKQLPIYQYSYKADPSSTMHVGPMAQDVEKIDKRAVTTRGGVKHIYPNMVMGSIMRAA